MSVTGCGVEPCQCVHLLTDPKSVAAIYVGACKAAVKVPRVRK